MKVTAALRERRANTRYYGFEETLEKMPSWAPLRARKSIADLQLIAGLVWAQERGPGKCPSVRPRPDGKAKRSYYIWTTRTVELIPKHRNLGSLLHELAHALGPNDKMMHGAAFRSRCLKLYKTYGGWDGTVTFP